METISIPANTIKAARLFQAVRDSRYYLNGICIQKEGYVVGTNGHYMIRIECEEAKLLDKDMIISIGGTIPVKSHMAQFVFFESGDEGYIYFESLTGHIIGNDNLREIRPFKLIDGQYPDVKRVLPQGKLKACEEIIINFDYAVVISKAMKILGSKYPQGTFKLRGNQQALEIDVKTPHHTATIVLMPVRAE